MNLPTCSFTNGHVLPERCHPIRNPSTLRAVRRGLFISSGNTDVPRPNETEAQDIKITKEVTHEL